MDYYNKYKNFMNLSTSSDDIADSTRALVNANFDNAYFTETILVEDVEYKAIVKQEKKSADKKIILKPDTKIEIGSKVNIKSSVYLTLDFLGEGINQIYPTATLKLCNYTLKIKTGETKVLKGYDAMKRPIYEITPTYENIPCIITNTSDSFNSTNLNQAINLPSDKMRIIVKYDELNKTIKENDEFDIYGREFKVMGIDFTSIVSGKGVITLNMERVVA